jgi:hypothetical protein
MESLKIAPDIVYQTLFNLANFVGLIDLIQISTWTNQRLKIDPSIHQTQPSLCLVLCVPCFSDWNPSPIHTNCNERLHLDQLGRFQYLLWGCFSSQSMLFLSFIFVYFLEFLKLWRLIKDGLDRTKNMCTL